MSLPQLKPGSTRDKRILCQILHNAKTTSYDYYKEGKHERATKETHETCGHTGRV
jgi:hypothetical protein